jgi:hypothetical protein
MPIINPHADRRQTARFAEGTPCGCEHQPTRFQTSSADSAGFAVELAAV